MNKTTKTSKLNTVSIIFYVMAVIFLCLGAYYIYFSYMSVAEAKLQYTLTLHNILNFYFSNCASYFAYAFILYGVGFGLNKINILHLALHECVSVAEEESLSVEAADVEAIDETLSEEVK